MRGGGKAGSKPVLAHFFSRPTTLKGWYRGYEYKARLRTNGTIRYGNQIFTKPTVAAQAARGGNCNGWWFWHFKKGQEWIRPKELKL